jgi:hypothetical protein
VVRLFAALVVITFSSFGVIGLVGDGEDEGGSDSSSSGVFVWLCYLLLL